MVPKIDDYDADNEGALNITCSKEEMLREWRKRKSVLIKEVEATPSEVHEIIMNKFQKCFLL